VSWMTSRPVYVTICSAVTATMRHLHVCVRMCALSGVLASAATIQPSIQPSVGQWLLSLRILVVVLAVVLVVIQGAVPVLVLNVVSWHSWAGCAFRLMLCVCLFWGVLLDIGKRAALDT
jgi:hypothetical protein